MRDVFVHADYADECRAKKKKKKHKTEKVIESKSSLENLIDADDMGYNTEEEEGDADSHEKENAKREQAKAEAEVKQSKHSVHYAGQGSNTWMALRGGYGVNT